WLRFKALICRGPAELRAPYQHHLFSGGGSTWPSRLPLRPRETARLRLLRAPRRHRPPAAQEVDGDRPVRVDVQDDVAANVSSLDVDREGGNVPRDEVDASRLRDTRHGTPRLVLASVRERRGEVASCERAGAELRPRRGRVADTEPV